MNEVDVQTLMEILRGMARSIGAIEKMLESIDKGVWGIQKI